MVKGHGEDVIASEDLSELPEGWDVVRFDTLVSPSREKVEPADCPGVPYLSLEHLKSGGYCLDGRGQASDVRSTKTVFHTDDVLYGKLRPYLNKVWTAEFDGVCSTDILVFPRSESVLPKFLAWWLGLPENVEYATAHSKGNSLPRVSFSDLGVLTMPLVPLAEQKRIVAKVEELLTRVNAVRERLGRVPTILKRFRQSVLAAACYGRLTEEWREKHPDTEPASALMKRVCGARSLGNVARDGQVEIPDTWAWLSVDQICAKIVDCPHSTPKWTETGEVCLRTTNFRPGALDLSDVRHVSPATFAERTTTLLPEAGDVLYSREGGILGIACVIPAGARVCLGQRMMLMRTNHRILVSDFLMSVLNSSIILRLVRELTGGTSSPHLNVGDIRRFQIPLPPPGEQREIVRRVEALFQLADDIEKRVKSATARAERLTQSILAKAFRGELVPTEAELARQEGRTFEPASVLLERIMSARATLDGGSGAPRTRRAANRKRQDSTSFGRSG